MARNLLSPHGRKLSLPFSNSPWRSIKTIPAEMVEQNIVKDEKGPF